MNTETSQTVSGGIDPNSFMLELRGNRYACHRMQKRGDVFFQVVFKTSLLYVTRALGADGFLFWTSIPEDPKLSHIVQEIGEQIEKHFK